MALPGGGCSLACDSRPGVDGTTTCATTAALGGAARDPGGDAAQDGRARCQSGAAVLLGLAQQVGLASLGYLVHQVRVHRVLSECLSVRSEVHTRVSLRSCSRIVLSAVETTSASSATITEASDVDPSTHVCLAVIVGCLLELCYPIRHQGRARIER